MLSADHLSPAQRAARGDWAGCIAGALSESEYRQQLSAAGFTDVQTTLSHQVADGMHSAIVRGAKPA